MRFVFNNNGGVNVGTRKKMEQATCPLVMSVGDMALEYELAADPDHQIQIFADLNGCLESRIAWLLNESGCKVNKRKLPWPQKRIDGGVDMSEIYAASPEAEQARAFRARREAERQESGCMHIENETVIEDREVEVNKEEPVKENAKEKWASADDIGKGRYFDSTALSAAALRRVRMKEVAAGYWSVFLREKFGFVGELSRADVEYMEALCDMAQGLARMMEG